MNSQKAEQGAVRKPLPPSYFAGALAVIVVLALIVPGPTVIAFPWNVLGAIPVVLGGVLNVVADRQFKVAATTVKPFEASSALVTDGVFRFTRNPMYLGMALALAGVAMLLQRLTPWIVLPLFVAAMQIRFIGPEERMLQEQFGERWESYARTVRQWI